MSEDTSSTGIVVTVESPAEPQKGAGILNAIPAASQLELRFDNVNAYVSKLVGGQQPSLVSKATSMLTGKPASPAGALTDAKEERQVREEGGATRMAPQGLVGRAWSCFKCGAASWVMHGLASASVWPALKAGWLGTRAGSPQLRVGPSTLTCWHAFQQCWQSLPAAGLPAAGLPAMLKDMHAVHAGRVWGAARAPNLRPDAHAQRAPSSCCWAR